MASIAKGISFWRAAGRTSLVLAALTLLHTAEARAWDGFGHMQIAEIAWTSLDAATRARVGQLLKLNPQYAHWIAGVPAGEEDHIAFVIAATWADYIKGDSSYMDDGPQGGNRPPPGPEAGQNIGYSDHLRHRYWHFIDGPFSQDGTTLELTPVPNAQTLIELLRDTLSTSATDDIKSYDLIWLLHIVGDIHQPLHATSRFTTSDPHGDQGGNDVKIDCGGCAPTKLHWFWDNAGGEGAINNCAAIDKPECNPENVQAAITAAHALPPADPSLASISDETVWINESFQLAQTQVYQPPIGDGSGPFTLTTDYKQAAAGIANTRFALAGARLGNLIKAWLK
jgi:S1/P1 Nuclease